MIKQSILYMSEIYEKPKDILGFSKKYLTNNLINQYQIIILSVGLVAL